MRIFIFLLLLLASSALKGQQWFNKKYTIPDTISSIAFSGVIFSNDTLYTYGAAMKQGDPSFGLMFARLDTLGNLLDYKIYYDSLGGDFNLFLSKCFIKLKDNSGFAAIGRVATFGSRLFLVKFDFQGNITSFVQFNDDISGGSPTTLLETDDGFMMSGWRTSFTYVIQTDKNANIKWVKKFESPGRLLINGDLIKINNNKFAIGGGTVNELGSVPVEQIVNSSVLIIIDSSGNTISQTETSLSRNDMGIVNLFQMPNGGWAYATREKVWHEEVYDYFYYPRFIIRDSNFNLVKAHTFPTSNSEYCSVYNSIKSSDGGWLIAGNQHKGYLPGLLLKLNSEGDSLWVRRDTAYWGPIAEGSPISGSENYLLSVTELPSGSIIGSGYCNINAPLPERSWAWLIKVDKNGCMDTLLCSTSSTVIAPAKPESGIQVYPNPADDYVRFSMSSGLFPQSAIVKITDINGRTVVESRIPEGSSSWLWNAEGTAGGLYYYQILINEASIQNGKIVLYR